METVEVVLGAMLQGMFHLLDVCGTFPVHRSFFLQNLPETFLFLNNLQSK
jgi:hypothetical protein